MKLQVKTLCRKSLLIDIDESSTVYDLKKELSLYPDVAVKPELQKLIYSGKILANEDQLSVYNIDTKKFLVVMVLKQPEESPTTSSSMIKTEASAEAAVAESVKEEKKEAEKMTTESVVKEEFKTPEPPAASVAASGKTNKEDLVRNIVAMGYPESEVRRALAASFYNPERAIEYLIEGIPTSPSTPEGGGYVDTDADQSLSPFEVFRSDPVFRNLRRAVLQHPDLIDQTIQQVGEANPDLFSLISENQEEFLSMLIEASDDEDESDDGGDEENYFSRI